MGFVFLRGGLARLFSGTGGSTSYRRVALAYWQLSMLRVALVYTVAFVYTVAVVYGGLRLSMVVCVAWCSAACAPTLSPARGAWCPYLVSSPRDLVPLPCPRAGETVLFCGWDFFGAIMSVRRGP